MAFAARMNSTVLAATMALGVGLSAAPGKAAYVLTLSEVGGDVVATGSGTINTESLVFAFPKVTDSYIYPEIAAINTGPGNVTADWYTALLDGPSSFGSGVQKSATSGSGDEVALQNGFGAHLIIVPEGYVSGASLSSSSTYAGATFASLGVTPGAYVWTWGNDADADSFTLVATATVAAIPEPSTWAMALLGLAGLGLLNARGARKAATAA